MNLEWLKPTKEKILWTLFLVLLDFPILNLDLLISVRGLSILLVLCLLAYLTVSLIQSYAQKYKNSIAKGKINETKYSKIKTFFWIIGMFVFIIFWTTSSGNFYSYFEKFGVMGEILFFIILTSPFIILLFYAFRSISKS